MRNGRFTGCTGRSRARHGWRGGNDAPALGRRWDISGRRRAARGRCPGTDAMGCRGAFHRARAGRVACRGRIGLPAALVLRNHSNGHHDQPCTRDGGCDSQPPVAPTLALLPGGPDVRVGCRDHGGGKLNNRRLLAMCDHWGRGNWYDGEGPHGRSLALKVFMRCGYSAASGLPRESTGCFPMVCGTSLILGFTDAACSAVAREVVYPHSLSPGKRFSPQGGFTGYIRRLLRVARRTGVCHGTTVPLRHLAGIHLPHSTITVREQAGGAGPESGDARDSGAAPAAVWVALLKQCLTNKRTLRRCPAVGGSSACVRAHARHTQTNTGLSTRELYAKAEDPALRLPTSVSNSRATTAPTAMWQVSEQVRRAGG